jgi:3-oxoacyl-(acyl-carrier-protein) synthase
LNDCLSGRVSVPPAPPPELTAFEVPSGAPAWGFEVLDLPLEKELPNIKSFIDRTSALALLAAKPALADAKLLPGGDAAAADSMRVSSETGCAYGTMLGCLEGMSIFWNKVKTTNPKFAQPLPFTQSYANSPSSLLCIQYGLRGPAATFSGERLAGIEALQFAFDQVRSGDGDIVLAGASESLSLPAFNHLLASGQLSVSGKWEDGAIPGEGAVALVLESAESAQRRGVKAYAEIESVGIYRLPADGTSSVPGVEGTLGETAVFAPVCGRRPGGLSVSLLVAKGVPMVDARLFSGDMLAASPVLDVALAAQILGRPMGSGPLTGNQAVRRCVALACAENNCLGVTRLARIES